MLPTFVIGLREGLEAALVVGIVAAFLAQAGQRRALRLVWTGVALAVVVCVGFGVALDLLSRDLPQQQQEALEAVIGLVAVVMVTSMIVWMRRHAHELRGRLEASAGAALAAGSAWALVAMAFLAVIREGFETSVFLLATFKGTADAPSAVVGAVLGLVVAVVLGALVYRGGLRLDLARFFAVTGVVLVLVAAGLLVTSVHAAHGAGFLTFGQREVLDLSGVVRPGTPVSAVLTGVLGLQPHPTVVELVVYLAFAVPLLGYVLRPRSRPGPAVRAAVPLEQTP